MAVDTTIKLIVEVLALVAGIGWIIGQVKGTTDVLNKAVSKLSDTVEKLEKTISKLEIRIVRLESRENGLIKHKRYEDDDNDDTDGEPHVTRG